MVKNALEPNTTRSGGGSKWYSLMRKTRNPNFGLIRPPTGVTKIFLCEKKKNAIQENEMVQQSRVFGRWKVLDRRIYDMSSVGIGSLFAFQIEGQNFQKN